MSPGVDGIFPALLLEGRDALVPCQVKVVFIPKPGKANYGGPKDYRPMSLASFLLKTMERLVDRFIRDELAVSSPLHLN
jgi:hypothetical protein